MLAAFTIKPTLVPKGSVAAVEVFNAFGDRIATGKHTLKAMGYTWVWITAAEQALGDEGLVRTFNHMASQLIEQPAILSINFTMEV